MVDGEFETGVVDGKARAVREVAVLGLGLAVLNREENRGCVRVLMRRERWGR